MGTRTVPFTREVYIDRDDFMEVPPNKKWKRLSLGEEVRLRYGYVIRCTEVIKDDQGEIVELRATYDPDTLGADPAGRKVRGVIHWVSVSHGVPAEIRLYDRLFKVPIPGADKDDDWLSDINPESLVVVQGVVEPSLAKVRPGDRFQFEREGYFCVDTKDSTPERLVFNRTVTLRDTWAKIAGQK